MIGMILNAGLLFAIDDIARIIHLAAIAVALGTVVSTDVMSFRRVEREVTNEYCLSVESAHGIITPCLIVAWISGLIILGLQTGFDTSAFSLKLWAKLMVVTSLTITAIAVKFLVLPAIHRNIGRTLMEADMLDTFIMAVCAGLSMAGWGSALVLGGLEAAKTAPGWLVMSSVILIHIAVLTVALRSALALNSKVRSAANLMSRNRFLES